MRYTNKEWSDLTAYKNDIVGVCSVCDSDGYLPDESICKCMMVFKYIKRLYLASIPSEYWNLSLNDLSVSDNLKKVIDFYLLHFDNAFKKHKGIMFLGSNGVGKTSLMCEIGKRIIAYKYSVKFFTFDDFIQAIYTNNIEFFDSLKSADVHLLDEFGKGYIKEGSYFIPSKVENYIKNTIASKVLILTTNLNLDDLRDTLGDSIISALKRQIENVVVDGDDYSETRQSNWADDIKTSYDYYHKNIMECVRIFNERK